MSSKHPLLTEILQGESKTLEFKATLPKGDQLAKTLIAFANTSGGKLVVGVDDNRQLVGLHNADIFVLQDKIASIVHELCSPNLLPEIYIENVRGTELLVIEVSRGALLPYYLKPKGREQGTFIRLGATNRQASPDYIQELERQRLNISFDEQINYNQPLAGLDLAPLKARFSQAGKVLNEDKLLNLRLIQREQCQDFPTHGLLILLGQYEHVETKCSRFKGNTMVVFLDKKEYRGDLFSQLEQTELFIKNHLHLKAEILGLQRTETYEIPIPAIREALVNAVLHRDYTNFGRDIKVGIYDDMLNIVSPGGLPNGLTPADLQQGRSEIRNRVLARVFKELGYIEQWGSGIGRIKAMCREAGNAEPKIQERGDFVDWEFYRLEHFGNVISEAGLKVEKGGSIGGSIGGPIGGSIPDEADLTERQQQVLALIKADSQIPYRKMAECMGINESALKKHLNKLKEAGYIRRIGGTRGYWEVRQ